MKIIFLLIVITGLIITTNAAAQPKQNAEQEFVIKNVRDTCPEPKASDFESLCADIAMRTKVPDIEQKYFEYNYEKRLLKMACVIVGVDDEEITRKKMQIWWNKYKTKCKCDALGFGLPNGNFLKFTIAQNMPEVIETLVLIYELDINFTDPTDKKNLLDYLNDELRKMQTNGSTKEEIKIYEEYKETFISLGAKPSK